MYKPNQIARIEAGLCFSCGEPRDNETLRCTPCREKANARSKGQRVTKYRDARLRGVCLECGVTSTTARCAGCYEKTKTYRSTTVNAEAQRTLVRRREEANLCVTCGKEPPAIGSPRCSGCLVKLNRRQRESKARRAKLAKATGKCVSCDGKCVGTTKYCLEHYVNYIVRSSSFDSALIKPLVDKAIAQDMRCALTGVARIPGKNMSLEHVKARQSHPELSNEISNLVWADLSANRAKRETSIPDLIAFAKAIVSRETELLALDAAVALPSSPLPATL